MISKETKTAIIAEYKINERDTGSPEVSVTEKQEVLLIKADDREQQKDHSVM